MGARRRGFIRKDDDVALRELPDASVLARDPAARGRVARLDQGQGKKVGGGAREVARRWGWLCGGKPRGASPVLHLWSDKFRIMASFAGVRAATWLRSKLK